MSAYHTEQCLNAQRRHQAEMAAYIAQYPNACPSCSGWGGHVSSYDPSPAGVSLGSGSFTEFEPCDHCYCTGKCPRCAGQFQQDNLTKSEPCPHCGWYDGTAGAPEFDGCDCWAACNPIT